MVGLGPRSAIERAEIGNSRPTVVRACALLDLSGLLDCISATYWRATLQRSRASITGMVAIRLSFGRWAGVMSRPGLQDTRWTASSRRLATAAQGAYPTPLDRGRVGILGHVLQHGPEMEHSFGMELRNPRFRQR